MVPMSPHSDEADSLPHSHGSRSTLVSRNVTISGHRTSIRLEPEMWSALSDVCRREGGNLHEICTAVASRKDENTSLTAAIRVFVMSYYRAAATEEGHSRARHGYGVATMSGADIMTGRAGPVSQPQSAPQSPFGELRPIIKSGTRLFP